MMRKTNEITQKYLNDIIFINNMTLNVITLTFY